MWPRAALEVKLTCEELDEKCPILQEPGVYILYRDKHPYYIGKTNGRLFERISFHASVVSGRYFNFWNYFSAFAVRDEAKRNELEKNPNRVQSHS